MSIRLDRFRQRGLSLIELIVAIVIIGVCVAGVLSVYQQAVRGSADPMMTKQAFAIAEALLEEVQLAPFTFCDAGDPVAENAAGTVDCTVALQPGVRPFDHVLKYNGLALNPVTAIDGSAIPAVGYSATVAVLPAALHTIGAGGDAVQITVSVTAPDTNVYVLQGWRTRYAPNAVP